MNNYPNMNSYQYPNMNQYPNNSSKDKGKNTATIVAALITGILGLIGAIVAANIGISKGREQADTNIESQLSIEYSKGYAIGYEDGKSSVGVVNQNDRYQEGYETGLEAGKALNGSRTSTNPLSTTPSNTSVLLSRLNWINRYSFWDFNQKRYDGPIDPLGENYEGKCRSYLITHTSGSSWAEYKTNFEYTRLTGTLVPHALLADNKTVYMMVYKDNDGTGKFDLIYTSDGINRKSEPLSINVDISGTKFIKITFGGAVLALDLELHKN